MIRPMISFHPIKIGMKCKHFSNLTAVRQLTFCWLLINVLQYPGHTDESSSKKSKLVVSSSRKLAYNLFLWKSLKSH